MILEKERVELCVYSKEYSKKGLTRGTGGNLSIRCPEEQLVAIRKELQTLATTA